jgi:UDP-N-acetylglucosamine transferase subunit ALG13
MEVLEMNVFVTVGAQESFDRLIMAIDGWAANHTGMQIYAQIGESSYRPENIEYVTLLEPPEFRRRVLWADVLVAHAGMGSILTALQYGKPILVMPRQGRLKETRNDHQVATALRIKAMSKVAVAMDEDEIPALLDSITRLGASELISDKASDQLLSAVRSFIQDTPR